METLPTRPLQTSHWLRKSLKHDASSTSRVDHPTDKHGALRTKNGFETTSVKRALDKSFSEFSPSRSEMKLPHPDSLPEAIQVGALLVLLLGLTYLLRPKDLIGFITRILEKEEE